MIKRIVQDTVELSKVVSHHIGTPNVPFVRNVVAEMYDVARYYDDKSIGCAGLAANQIGYDIAILIYWDGGGFPTLQYPKGKNYVVMINPVITKSFGGKDMMREGCLSRPGKSPRIKRNKKIKVSYINMSGDAVEAQYRGYTARIIQHEIDHLNGIYIA